MARYLARYVGTYRVKAMYDLATNDYPRDEYGEIEPSFDDLYIPCKSDCMIRHFEKDNLYAYIPSIKRGHNIIDSITEQYGGDIIYKIDETSVEVTFLFKAKNIDKIATIMGAFTSGKDVSPFSKKNLPKAKYDIPEQDMKVYKELVKDIPFEKIIKISKVYEAFDVNIRNKKGKDYNVKFERTKSALKQKEFIHSIGMWEEFIKFLKSELPNF